MKIIVYDDFNHAIPQRQDIIGTVRPTFGSGAPRNGYKIIEIYDEDEDDVP